MASRAEKSSKKGSVGQIPLLDRDLQWLHFNARVLDEARNPLNPPMERLRFLMIHQSNLDEFYMKRVHSPTPARRAGRLGRELPHSVAQHFREMRKEILFQAKVQYDVLTNDLIPLFQKEGVHLLSWSDLSGDDKRQASLIFHEQIAPHLNPTSVQTGHPIPFLPNLSLSIGVLLGEESKPPTFVNVLIPASLPHWHNLASPDSKRATSYISSVELIFGHLPSLFKGQAVQESLLYRITRMSEVERSLDEDPDLKDTMEEEVYLRRFAKIVRLETTNRPNGKIVPLLAKEFQLTESDIYASDAHLNLQGFLAIYQQAPKHLKFPDFNGRAPVQFQGKAETLLSVVLQRDLLVHHPYDDFSASIERLILEAAEDPKVRSIKMTLYRTNDDSHIMQALIRAARLGKHVVCVVEVKARFDEERNLYWAKCLEDAGATVIYGVAGLKTHSKIALIAREIRGETQTICHIGTGNYNSTTSRLYTDVGLLTSDPQITVEVATLFNYLTGRSKKTKTKNLLVSPFNMKSRFLELIQREAKYAQAGAPAHIIAKMNSLEDPELINALYEASRAGVKIDLIVRGFCSLVPAKTGWSENITVRSVIGRFLEHSRIYYFARGSREPLSGQFFIGSSDWMVRNLVSRIEVVTPIFQPNHQGQLWEILTMLLRDVIQSWEMKTDGTYHRVPNLGPPAPQVGVQTLLAQPKR